MLSEELEIIIQKAFQLAKNKRHEFLTLEHLLVELCNDKEVLSLFNNLLVYKVFFKLSRIMLLKHIILTMIW